MVCLDNVIKVEVIQMKTMLEFEDELSFKEERVSYWEQYGCVLSKDGLVCDPKYYEVRL
jgi:hypothetical protein